MVNDFLFELGSEELPSAAVWPLANALAVHVAGSLDKAQIAYCEIRAFATPRRLAVLISGLASEQPGQTTVRRGPALSAAYDKAGQPTQALLGFAKSCQVDVSALAVNKTEKGEWLCYESVSQRAKVADLMPAFITEALATLPIAKPMRWGKGEMEFVRPVHWALMLFGESVIACDLLGVRTGNVSYGHRFHHPSAIRIDKPAHYENLLQDAQVIVDFATRRNTLCGQIQALATSKNAKAIMPAALVDEVTSIVEWPNALLAQFEQSFLDVPAEALIASMQAHQKCFALQNNQGELLPYFITVANIESSNPNQVISGNEKVMRARLSDAAFFFNQDKKSPLSAYLPATELVVFQDQLGSLSDKSKRIEALMAYLSAPLGLALPQAKRAALLGKCDLLTGMVGEFPELQGVMGCYYARHDGEEEAVALALQEQYLPRFAADSIPHTTLGLALSLADRMDTLVGIFAIGQKPSGVKDPFKLRRHALAVVRMLLVTKSPLSLTDLIHASLRAFGDKLPKAHTQCAELKPFILDRLHSYYQSLGFRADFIAAVEARQNEELYDFDKRIHALVSFINLPEASSLSQACKRVNNILQQAGKAVLSETLDKKLLEEGAEQALVSHLEALEERLKPLYAREDYGQILNQLASLRTPVDAFFEQVMVMVEDIALKTNRLNLLARLQHLLQGVADISLLQLSV
ncbi:MAG: glycine--tRNA ligase subunit beta [Tatlockia sp.]|jgi:glycyl-tRNA synthetase beta chain